MVARLARLDAEDRDAILAELDERSRARVSKALAARQQGAAFDGPESGFSPWLLEKLARGQDMTEHAHAALVALREKQSAPLRDSRSQPPGPSLLSRLGNSLRRGGEPA